MLKKHSLGRGFVFVQLEKKSKKSETGKKKLSLTDDIVYLEALRKTTLKIYKKKQIQQDCYQYIKLPILNFNVRRTEI